MEQTKYKLKLKWFDRRRYHRHHLAPSNFLPAYNSVHPWRNDIQLCRVRFNCAFCKILLYTWRQPWYDFPQAFAYFSFIFAPHFASLLALLASLSATVCRPAKNFQCTAMEFSAVARLREREFSLFLQSEKTARVDNNEILFRLAATCARTSRTGNKLQTYF